MPGNPTAIAAALRAAGYGEAARGLVSRIDSLGVPLTVDGHRPVTVRLACPGDPARPGSLVAEDLSVQADGSRRVLVATEDGPVRQRPPLHNERMRNRSIRLPDAMWGELAALGPNVGATVRTALRAWLDQHGSAST